MIKHHQLKTMKSLNLFFCTIILGLLATSCNKYPCMTKGQFVESYKTFFKELDKKDDVPEEEVFADYNDYKSLVNDCYKKFEEELSLEEKQFFWKNSLVIVLKNYSPKIREVIKEDKEFRTYVFEQIEKTVKSSSSDIADSLIKALEDELPDLIENLSDEFENFGKKLIDEILNDK